MQRRRLRRPQLVGPSSTMKVRHACLWAAIVPRHTNTMSCAASGCWYYCNEHTGDTQWEPPAGVAFPADGGEGTVASTSTRTAHSTAPLPDGWEQFTDEAGYVHTLCVRTRSLNLHAAGTSTTTMPERASRLGSAP